MLPGANPSTLTDAEIQRHIDGKTKPIGALGRIEQIAAQIARITGNLTPDISTCELIIFAADHGIVEEGVSAYPQVVTREMVMNFLRGGAAANVFAHTLGVDLRVIDAGVAGESMAHPNLISHRIGAGTRNSAQIPAMTPDDRDQALNIGRHIGETTTADVACFGEMGIGNTSSATLLTHKLTGAPLDELTGRGTGLDDKGLERKLEILVRAAQRTEPTLSVHEALIQYGGYEIAMMAGAMMGASKVGKIVIVDGFISCAAALVAYRLVPASRENMVFAHRSEEPGAIALLKSLDAEPLLDLNMRLGEGTGALLAWPLVKAAAAMLRDMASFEDAGVSSAT